MKRESRSAELKQSMIATFGKLASVVSRDYLLWSLVEIIKELGVPRHHHIAFEQINFIAKYKEIPPKVVLTGKNNDSYQGRLPYR